MEEAALQYNAIEAALWAIFALGFAIEAIRTLDPARKWASVFAVAFLAFGLSDLVEMSTGASWRPA